MKAFPQISRRFVISWTSSPSLLLRLSAVSPPAVTFSYVDSGYERTSSFASHLDAYQKLFRQLDTFRFLYIATKEAYFRRAEEQFRSIIKRPLEADASNEILRYFQIRKRWDNHEYIIPVTEDLEFLRDARDRFQNENIECLYRSWSLGELGERELRAKLSLHKQVRAIYFDTYLINGRRSSLLEIAEQGDRCMKDADHPSVHRFVHPAGERKC
jgi:hypothetical protein